LRFSIRSSWHIFTPDQLDLAMIHLLDATVNEAMPSMAASPPFTAFPLPTTSTRKTSSARMINENRVRLDMGFDTNGHRDAEILSDLPQGELTHRDRIGKASPICSVDLRRMSAGSGIRYGHGAELLVFELAQ
jgi:redox-sensitive bicupin YhaK (pirin superfamily)